MAEDDNRRMGETRAAARVTVLIPCFNDGALLQEALGSIVEDEPVRIVVIDDCSTERETLALLEAPLRPDAQVLRLDENGGPSRARNAGLAVTRSPYVFPLDADDLAVPGALSALADRLDADASLAVCYGDYAEFGDHDLVRAVPHRLDGYRIAYANEYPASALFRRSALEAVGGWRDVRYEDWDLWMALAEQRSRSAHLGARRLTFRKRLHGERRLVADKRAHKLVYRSLREGHPVLFADIRRLRRESDLPLHRKLLYPAVYGGRRRFALERSLKRALDRAGLWTLRR
jgi:glycosyltransferase involved in cell wall biosynthesis